MAERVATVSTPYDDAFKTVISHASRLLIPLVNEIFGRNFALTEEVHFENTEFIDFTSDDTQKKTRADTVFTIGNDTIRYHIECQTNSDASIVIRVFEYASHIAHMHSEKRDGVTVFHFPDSAIFYLRNSNQIPEKFHPARLEFSDGNGIDFKIPVIRMFDYSIDSLFQKNLYMMLPFYLFNLEKMVEEKEGNDEAQKIVFDTVQTIIQRLESDELAKVITSRECVCLKTLVGMVGRNVMKPYPVIAKGVEEMGGKVLDYEGNDIFVAGEKSGEVKGENRMSLLVAHLMADQKYDDVVKVTSDDSYRKTLYAAYGIA